MVLALPRLNWSMLATILAARVAAVSMQSMNSRTWRCAR